MSNLLDEERALDQGRAGVVTMFDSNKEMPSELCRNFTNEFWSNLEGITKNYKNIIYHLNKSK